MNKLLYLFIRTKTINFGVDEKGRYIDGRLNFYKPYPYDENYYYYPKNYTYNEATRLLIKQKYDIEDEINRIANQYAEPEKYEEYRAYVESCKEEAKLFANIKESWYK